MLEICLWILVYLTVGWIFALVESLLNGDPDQRGDFIIWMIWPLAFGFLICGLLYDIAQAISPGKLARKFKNHS